MKKYRLMVAVKTIQYFRTGRSSAIVSVYSIRANYIRLAIIMPEVIPMLLLP
jgi:hypothetical protein